MIVIYKIIKKICSLWYYWWLYTVKIIIIIKVIIQQIAKIKLCNWYKYIKFVLFL